MAKKIKKLNYDMRLCKCGTIHLIDYDKIDEALKANKNTVVICERCGNSFIIGADIEPDWENPELDCYNMYCWDYPEKTIEFTSESFNPPEGSKEKPIDRIIYSAGIKVPMRSGMYATDCFDGRFSDRWYPDFWKIRREDITVEEIFQFIDKYTEDRTTVDMQRFINENPEDIIEFLSHFWINGFDWRGTPYESEWNTRHCEEEDKRKVEKRNW